ncbi:MAG: VCBS repeat-containing protein, partial [Acidobacteriota bacterium]
MSKLARRLGLVAMAFWIGFAPSLSADAQVPPEPRDDSPWFEDITAIAGVDQPHQTRRFDNPYAHIMEGYTALGASASIADYDLDGFEDVFFTRSNTEGENLLFRNRGDLTFEEVGEAAGVAHGNDRRNASADSLWFDLEGDGDPDLLVVRFGQNLLYENLAEQRETSSDPVRFVDITRRAGLEGRFNCIVAIAFDYDLDGDLDLFLGNYFAPVDLFDPKTPRFFPESFET